MPPAFALSQDQTLRFISAPGHQRPSASTNRPKLNQTPPPSTKNENRKLSKRTVTHRTPSNMPSNTSNGTRQRYENSRPNSQLSPGQTTQTIQPTHPGRRQRIPSYPIQLSMSRAKTFNPLHADQGP